ncbi:MAG: pyridine nucleotide-disulfide oxidoreductase [Candidatus Harrisonbacteria bacterium CG10_big_fil_rev_8_21_14_0_10_49_15]|uniref:Pyridine nucleotide-disulfide oxidoreductase n=1 Tax=Candidatus Harrisonbacteria bacterium CG10_big_fil_rev_8_21_14_0_10_49_15 TaxID=1974587 RepID=A0A2H0ULX6_9BACT|nr:MAG: pyridine nucleotide-disulfide oxidoreductase [Candidatus Harrisonbacteria bacterium CG10_big_fil_rev_8_21_14_0_10_49_15]
MLYELLIVGGGPAAAAAGVYAGRKQIKTLLITEEFGGQSVVSNDIHNWIGTKSISGIELAKSFEGHVREQETLTIVDGDLVTEIQKVNDGPPQGHFVIKTRKGDSYEAKTVLITSGSRRRRLGIPGEDEFDGKGVVFCSTCDAPLFRGMPVAIVGGGNAALEAVVDSIPYATEITLLVRSNELKGDPVTAEKAQSHPKVKILFGAVSQEVVGEMMVTGLKYLDTNTNEIKILDVKGVFVEIGSIPNSEFVKDLVVLNKIGEIEVDPKTQQSSVKGIWAAGDVSDVLYKQNNISAGDSVKALLNIYDFLHRNNLTGAHD